ncbi:MAG: GH92 family glycosyl hydrolase [Bacteroidota bacterium]
MRFRRPFRSVAPLVMALLLIPSHTLAQSDQSPVSYVNPFIGTGGHGHTYPGATVPFGMVQLSPDAGKRGWDWCSGYHYSDSLLAGFSHTHLSGTGCADLGDILVTPGVSSRIHSDDYRAPFSHADESASPGYYSVLLRDSGIRAELTATTRAGFHRYTFPPGDSACVVVNLGYGQEDVTTESSCGMEGDAALMGSRTSNGWAQLQRVYFAARFSRPPSSVALITDGVPFPAGRVARGKHVKALLRFASGEPLLVKVGISAVSAGSALENVDGEIPGWDFDLIRQSAAEAWDQALRKITLRAEDESLKKTFYTALYHTMLAPTIYNDLSGRYRGGDDQVHAGAGFENYSTFSLWDTFRAAHPLYTIIEPDRVDDMVNAMLAFAAESGHLPVWPLAASETNTMIGYHAVPVIVDAWLKGIRGFDPETAYRAMKSSAIRDHRGLKYYSPAVASVGPAPHAGTDSPKGAPTGAVLNGFAAMTSGQTITYHSGFPSATKALIARATDGRSTVTWKTAPVSTKEKTVSFVWFAGMVAGRGVHRFDLYVNHQYALSFTTSAPERKREWSIDGRNGMSLSFRTTYQDWFGDLFGTMTLTVPIAALQSGSQDLQVTGENGGSPDWYMTFMHPFAPRMTLENEFGIENAGSTKMQVVRAHVEHLGPPEQTTITVGDGRPVTVWLMPGLNTFHLRVPAVNAPKSVTVVVGSKKKTLAREGVTLLPVRPVGYVPADKEPESVSKTLEYAYDDWCIAQMAKALGHKDDYALFMERAGYYRNVFDRSTGFMRGRNLDGSWVTPFDPRFSTSMQPEYTEGNAWQYTWFVPHDLQGLITLMGGAASFVERLDSLFNQSSNLEGTGAPPDVSGLIGLYAHGNEPSHHIAYLYDYAGEPWKTQEMVTRIMRTLYSSGPDGLSGNEDCGQMSAWFIFSALGFYPVNPADGNYLFGSPAVESATIDVGNHKTFAVLAHDLTDRNVFIQSASLNGRPLDRLYIRHEEIMKGGTLEFFMGPEPNHQWGTGSSALPAPAAR